MSLIKNHLVVQRKNKPYVLVLSLGSLYIMHPPIPSDSGSWLPNNLDKHRAVIFMPVAIHKSCGGDDASLVHIISQTMYIDPLDDLVDIRYEEPNSVKIIENGTYNEKLILTNRDIYNIFIGKEKSFKKKEMLETKLYSRWRWCNSAWDTKYLKSHCIYKLNKRVLDLSLWSLRSLDIWRNFHLEISTRDNIENHYKKSERPIAIETIQKRLAARFVGHSAEKKIQKDIAINTDQNVSGQEYVSRRILLNGTPIHISIASCNFGTACNLYCGGSLSAIMIIVDRNAIRLNGYTYIFADPNEVPKFYTSSYIRHSNSSLVEHDWELIPDPISEENGNDPIGVENNNNSDLLERPLNRISKKLSKLYDRGQSMSSLHMQLHSLRRYCKNKGETL